MFKASASLAQAMLGALKAALDGGKVIVYAGPEPANASDALDMATSHTELCVLTLGGSGAGLTLLAATGATISKPPADDWSGLNAFDGVDAGSGPLAPTFFRFCPAGDDGRTGGAVARIQGSAGGPASSASMKLASDTLTDDGVSTTNVRIFNSRIGSLG